MPYPPPRLTACPSALTVPLLSGFLKKCQTIPVPCFELASARGMWPSTSSSQYNSDCILVLKIFRLML